MFDKREWDAFQCERLNESEKGKLLLCYAKNDDDTRLFIHRFSYMSNACTKEGWWDTFTIASDKCRKGFHICRINSFRIDRNGYLNVLVTSIGYIGENVNEESLAWDLFFSTRLFCHQYSYDHYKNRFNVAHLCSLYQEQMEEYLNEQRQIFGDDFVEWRERYIFFFNLFLDGKITLEEIETALNEKTDIEKLAEDLGKNVFSHTKKYEEYPLITKKLLNNEDIKYLSDVESWVRRKNFEYDTLKLGEERDILVRIEDVLQYWEDDKQRKKEERKAKRKAAKNN